jgi:glyoxylase-like metal-dependent hydrolase (beta-lactamase superfamily II)
MLKFQTFVFNALSENTYIVWNNDSKNAIIIDPGNYSNAENTELDHFIVSNAIKPIYILNTHCHIDHILGNAYIKSKYKIPLLVPRLEQEILRYSSVIAPHYGFTRYQISEFDQLIDVDTKLMLDDTKIDIKYVPGHSPGHLAFLFEDDKLCFSGDVLFAGSIGRSDLPGGHHQTLINSIETQLFVLPPDFKVLPGHGPSTTILQEKKFNPFFNYK